MHRSHTTVMMRIANFILVLVVLLVAIDIPACGQDVGTDWKVGVRAGPSSMTLGGNLDGNIERRVGLSAGAFITVGLPGPFALQPELLYLQKGATVGTVRFVRRPVPIQIEQAIKISYLDIAPLGIVQVPGVPLVTPTIEVGPTLGIPLSSTRDVRIEDRTGREVDPDQIGFDPPPDLDVGSPEIGLLVGLGTNLSLGDSTLSVTGRYRLGLTDVTDGVQSLFGQQEISLGRNRGFSVTAGIAF